MPANPNVAPVALDCIAWAKKIAPNIEEVIADRGYTMKYQKFNRQLHLEAMLVVMDLDKKEVRRIRELMLGRKAHRLIEHCGTFFPWWLPEELHRPPQGLKGKKLRAWYDRRSKFRYLASRLASASGSVPGVVRPPIQVQGLHRLDQQEDWQHQALVPTVRRAYPQQPQDPKGQS